MDKSRGKKHVINKQKYKKKGPNKTDFPNSKTTSIKPKQKVELDSNSYRYESDSEDEHSGNYINSSTDFSILANQPLSQGSHFQFKNDKSLLNDDSSIQQHDLFNLDLNLLNLSITAVPFYKRHNLDEKYFSTQQITLMNLASKKYTSNVEENKSEIRNVIIHHENKDGEKEIIHEEIEKTNETVKNMNSCNSVSDTISLDELDLDTEVEKTDVQVENRDKANTEDLEQWLDDILDD